jgi:hypothetical protein
VRVVAQFKLVDGRVFEADKDVKVRPLPIVPQTPAPGPNPFIMPTGGISTSPLRWSAAPLTDVVDLAPPLPIAPP